MKIICAKTELMKGINIVLKAVPSKTTMKILECILIEAAAGQIRMTANDMELGIETGVQGVVEQPGTVALNAKLFSEIIRKLPEGEILLETDERETTTIRCEKSKFVIPGFDGEDFTPLPVIDRDDALVLSQFHLKELIRQTLFSVSTNDTNVVMTGELFEVKENVLRVVSLDGHRISMRRLYLAESYPAKSVIVPGKTLSELGKILSGETSDMVSIYFSDNHLMFEFDDTVVISRLIEGSYFRVDQMINRNFETKISVNKREILESIDRSLLMIKEDDKKPLLFEIEDESMKLQISSQIGNMEEIVAVEKEGKDIRIGFNPRLLMDALRVIDDEKVDIYYVNSKSPCIIRDEEETYLYLILPVNFI